MSHKLQTGIRLVGSGIGVVVLLYVAALFSLRLLGLDYAVVISNSMQPVTSRGDLVLLRQAPSYQLGDVVTFKRADRTVLHRLAKKLKSNTWRTQGDANSALDPWKLKTDEIDSYAVGRLAQFGWPLLLLQEFLHPPQVASTLNSSTKLQNQIGSSFWGPFSFSWTKLQRSFYISVDATGDLQILGYDDRKLYLNKSLTGSSRILFQGKLSAAPSTTAPLNLFMNGCAVISGDLNCGWMISFTNSTATLHVITTGNQVSSVLSSCTFKNPIKWTNTNRILAYKHDNKIGVLLNAESCLLSKSLNGLVAPNQLPSGGRSGIWVDGHLEVDAPNFLVF